MPVPEPLFNKVELKFFKKETVAQVFSCEFCEIFKNTFSYRTTPVAASVHKKRDSDTVVFLRILRNF